MRWEGHEVQVLGRRAIPVFPSIPTPGLREALAAHARRPRPAEIHPGSTRDSGQDRENGPTQVGPGLDRGIPTGTAPG